MAKFNVVQKRRRAALAEQKRKIHGDPFTGKLHLRQQPSSVSGKRKQKLLRKWRRDQREAVEKGLISMQDVEMADADEQATTKRPAKFSMKKSAKLRLKQIKKSEKKKKKSSQKPRESTIEAMVD